MELRTANSRLTSAAEGGIRLSLQPLHIFTSMAQPVLNVQENESKGSVAVNLLPCKVHHDGPVGSIHAHWHVDNPEGSSTPERLLACLW